MGIVHSQESAYVKEMAKWESEAVNIQGTFVMPIPIAEGGKKDWPYHEYPKMLYRAERADGGPRIADTLIVKSEAEESRERDRGWCVGPAAAVAAVHAQDTEFATLAANRAHGDRLMSDGARAEAAAHDESTMQHQPEVPATPIRKRGRPAKTE